jgi:hypothetical protein
MTEMRVDIAATDGVQISAYVEAESAEAAVQQIDTAIEVGSPIKTRPSHSKGDYQTIINPDRVISISAAVIED